MKTAISIPDDVFRAAERQAKRAGISRSKLYADAVLEYLKYQQRNNVKDILDRVYAAESSKVDPLLNAMQFATVSREDW